MKLTEFYKGERARIAHMGPLIVVCLEGAIEVSDLDQLERCQDVVVPTVKHVFSITVMNRGFMSVKPGSTERAAEIAARYKGKTGLSVVVVNGRGLMAVMARTGLAVYSMLDRSGTPMKTGGSVPEGLEQLRTAMLTDGVTFSPADIAAVQKYIDDRPLQPQPETRPSP